MLQVRINYSKNLAGQKMKLFQTSQNKLSLQKLRNVLGLFTLALLLAQSVAADSVPFDSTPLEIPKNITEMVDYLEGLNDVSEEKSRYSVFRKQVVVDHKRMSHYILVSERNFVGTGGFPIMRIEGISSWKGLLANVTVSLATFFAGIGLNYYGNYNAELYRLVEQEAINNRGGDPVAVRAITRPRIAGYNVVRYVSWFFLLSGILQVRADLAPLLPELVQRYPYLGIIFPGAWLFNRDAVNSAKNQVREQIEEGKHSEIGFSVETAAYNTVIHDLGRKLKFKQVISSTKNKAYKPR